MHEQYYTQLNVEFSKDSIDMVKFVDWNERRHQIDALNYLNINAKVAR